MILLGVALSASGPAYANTQSATFDAVVADAKAAMLTDPRAARRQAAAAAAIAARQPAALGRAERLATAEWLQGEAALRDNDIAGAAPLVERALAQLSNAPTRLRGDVMMSRGGVHAAQANVAAALADYLAAFRIFEQINETRKQSIALLCLAGIYREAQDYTAALRYYGQALEVYSGDPALSVSTFNNRGDVLKEVGRFDEAQAQFNDALTLARQMKSPLLQARILGNIARLQLQRGDVVAAGRAIDRALGLAATGEAAGWRSQLNAIAADVAKRRGALAQAQVLIAKSFAGVSLTKTDVSFREAHYTAYDIYRTLGDRPLALAHLQAMKRLDDEIWKLSASTNTALMAAKFGSARQDAQIAKLKADDLAKKIALEKAQVRFQRILFGSVAAAAIVVMALLAAGLIQTRRSRARLALSNTALEQALAAKTEFLATTSHEIRTPLNGILGMTQVMLADASLNAAARDRIGIVQDAGLTMRALVDDILDVAKMETGNLTMEREPFDLRDMLADVTRIWCEQARAKGLQFTLELGDCPRGIVGDAGRLRQIVFNLLSNAVKFTAAGEVRVRANCRGDRLEIAVSDTGIGIDQAKHEEIFESFKQADGGTTRQFGGTGLGLAICKNIARGMDGHIAVASTVGQGATFTLNIPFIAAELTAAPVASSNGVFLIVERNPIARAMLKAVLEPRAGAIGFAASCAEALALVADGAVTRILIDEATARGDGADPVAAIAALSANTAVPVAVLWAGADDATLGALQDAGVAQVIAKPIAGPALAARLYDTAHSTLVSQAA